MMKLSQAASYFNRTTFADAYRPYVTFRGRILPQDDNSRDSVSTERRVLAVDAGTTIPAKRAIMVGNQAWIVGTQSRDLTADDVLHEHYVMHRADALVKVFSFEQALTLAPGLSLYAGRVWVKDQREETESSHLYPQYQFYFSSAEVVFDSTRVDGEGSECNVLITMGDRWYLVRNLTFTAAGFQMALTDELPAPVMNAVQYSSMAYSRLTDSKTATTKTINAVILRWQSSFVYPTVYSPDFKEGDRQLAVLKSEVTPQGGDQVQIGTGKYRVVSSVSQGNLWFVHLAPA